jgi:flagellar hook-associated protein 3 FlgL
MRVTGTSYTAALVDQMNSIAARQYRLQNQATTGQRIQAPEDDPAGMGQALNLQAEMSSVNQYTANISTLQARTTAAFNVFQQLKTITDRIGEITTQANDGTKSAGDLRNFGTEVSQLTQRAVQLMNTKQGDQYLFAGTLSNQAPYTISKDADGNVTGVTYGGNSNVPESEIAEKTTIGVDVPGDNTSGSGPRGVIKDDRYGADLFNHMISLQNHLVAGDSNAVATVDQPQLANDEDNIIYQVATNGAMQSRLEAESTIAQNRIGYLKQSISDVAGADMTDTLVQLSQTQNAYQAALQSASSVLQLQQTFLNSLP